METSQELDEFLPAYSKDLEGFLPENAKEDLESLESILPKAYDELRRVASRQLRGQRHVTLQTTALVNEACVRLMESRGLDIKNRRQFFYWAARTMRHLLVERARRRGAVKRGGNQAHVPIDEMIQLADGATLPLARILPLNQALKRLEKRDPRQCRIVELRFFAGMTTEEVCGVLDISERTMRREWAMAKRWLARELSSDKV
ncbi:MAG: ECF-type sigma factor [Acidobacteriota bacterium]|nr:ECF-type sigma factor [Acidobacteriota bacterium]